MTSYLETDVVARLVDHLARLPELVEGVGDEALPAEAGVHGHEQDDVDLVENVPSMVKGRRGVEHESCGVAKGRGGVYCRVRWCVHFEIYLVVVRKG